MAKVTETKTAITLTLTLDEKEAAALCELLSAANFDSGEGEHLESVYNALYPGVDHYDHDHEIVNDEVVVTKDDA